MLHATRRSTYGAQVPIGFIRVVCFLFCRRNYRFESFRHPVAIIVFARSNVFRPFSSQKENGERKEKNKQKAAFLAFFTSPTYCYHSCPSCHTCHRCGIPKWALVSFSFFLSIPVCSARAGFSRDQSLVGGVSTLFDRAGTELCARDACAKIGERGMKSRIGVLRGYVIPCNV